MVEYCGEDDNWRTLVPHLRHLRETLLDVAASGNPLYDEDYARHLRMVVRHFEKLVDEQPTKP